MTKKSKIIKELLHDIYPRLINNVKISFVETNKVHDWRNHVPKEIIEIWDELTFKEQQMICIMSGIQASNEEWD